jgi:hypothetical protein
VLIWRSLNEENGKMRTMLIALATVGAFGVLGASAASAAPANGAAIVAAVDTASPAQAVRWYCHRGRVFLHWGRC